MIVIEVIVSMDGNSCINNGSITKVIVIIIMMMVMMMMIMAASIPDSNTHPPAYQFTSVQEAHHIFML